MKRCFKNAASLIVMLMTLFSAVSCNVEYDFGFKDLCFYHPHTAPVKVNVDWSSFSHIENPSGMTVYAWPQNPDEEMVRMVTHNLDAFNLDLEAGYFHAFVFNQSDSEYATIEFYNLEDYSKAEVCVKQIKSSWYSTKFSDTRVGSEPEWLAIDCLENIEVTQDMVEMAEEEFLATLPEANRHSGQKATREITKTIHDVGTLVPRSVIKNVDIYVHLENIVFLRSSLAAIPNMAEGCYISSLKTTERTVTHTLETWGMIYDDYNEDGTINYVNGAIKTSLSTFGVPAGHTGKPEENELYIKLLLVDNSTVLEQYFNIGDQLAKLTAADGTQVDENGNVVWPEVHVYWPEPLPEVQPVGGDGGAFDVGVNDWGDEIITELPLM